MDSDSSLKNQISADHSKLNVVLSAIMIVFGALLSHDFIANHDDRILSPPFGVLIVFGPPLMVGGLLILWNVSQKWGRAPSRRDRMGYLFAGGVLVSLTVASVPFPLLVFFFSPLGLVGVFLYVKGMKAAESYIPPLSVGSSIALLLSMRGASMAVFAYLYSNQFKVSQNLVASPALLMVVFAVSAFILALRKRKGVPDVWSEARVLFVIAIIGGAVGLTMLFTLAISLVWPLAA